MDSRRAWALPAYGGRTTCYVAVVTAVDVARGAPLLQRRWALDRKFVRVLYYFLGNAEYGEGFAAARVIISRAMRFIARSKYAPFGRAHGQACGRTRADLLDRQCLAMTSTVSDRYTSVVLTTMALRLQLMVESTVAR